MIYLDNAATTLEKPDSVRSAVINAMQNMSSPGRGGHDAAMSAAETVYRCREAACDLFHVGQPENVVFTFNATHALNIAIRSVVHPGDTVLISGYEHNAVTRPLTALRARIRVARSAPFDADSMIRQFEVLAGSDVNAVICTHVSNVFGYILPISRIASLCHQRGLPLIIDASQSAGCIPLSLDETGASFIAMPGHKGLYGPQGTGLLLCAAPSVPLISGGTGSNSMLQTMPDFLPDRLEAGTANVPGIAGLYAGISFIRETGIQSILQHEQKLLNHAASSLSHLDGITVFSASSASRQAGVLSFNISGLDSEYVAEFLNQQGIAVRSGLHCAPLAHQTAGTQDTGTVRISFSAFTTFDDVDCLLSAVSRLVSSRC